jgi:hypothetical protein|tara:strand:+ start:128 stop:445 length:318 start_codon:yes stop_codon:yes gene_type:complete
MAVLGNRVIKSIQRGSTGKGGGGGDVTINAVDLSKTIVNVSVATGKQRFAKTDTPSYAYQQAIGAGVYLSDSTTLTVVNGTYDTTSGTGYTFSVPSIYYEVVEYE